MGTRRATCWYYLLLCAPGVLASRRNDCLGNGTDAHRRASIRTKFGVPNGFDSCAIVGSSGLLLSERLGDEIDGHDFVLRTNLAPVGGFEEVVGSKTTVRVMNTEAMSTALLERACPLLRDENSSTWCPPYAIQINSKHHESHYTTALNNGCPGSDLDSPIITKTDVPSSDETIQHFHAFVGGNVMTGAWGIALAMHVCPNGMDIYGYTHSGNLRKMHGTQYHYCDAGLRPNAGPGVGTRALFPRFPALKAPAVPSAYVR